VATEDRCTDVGCKFEHPVIDIKRPSPDCYVWMGKIDLAAMPVPVERR